MTTPRLRSLVSLAAFLALAGCATAPGRVAPAAPVASDVLPLTIAFQNGARQHVHVYLIGEQREWLLGRVEPGARATLRLPEAAVQEGAGRMRLAVLTGQRVSLRAAGEPRAVITPVPQPATDIIAQRWAFSQASALGQLTALRLWQ